MTAREQLVHRLRESGHPFPESAEMVMTAGSELSATEWLRRIDEIPGPNEWRALPHPGLLSRPDKNQTP